MEKEVTPRVDHSELGWFALIIRFNHCLGDAESGWVSPERGIPHKLSAPKEDI